MITLLPVPHFSQRGHPGGCGVAVLMMLAPAGSFDKAYAAMGLKRGQWAHITENVRRGLNFYGIDSEYKRLPVFEIRDILAAKKPVIMLVDYGKLPTHLKRADYAGAHYLLACGFDADCILIHDPLGDDETGAYVPYPDGVLDAAMIGVPGNAYDHQCIVINAHWRKDQATPEAALTPELALKAIYYALNVDTLGDALREIRWLKHPRKMPL